MCSADGSTPAQNIAENYVNGWNDLQHPFGVFLLNSTIIAFSVTGLSALFGGLGGYYLSRTRTVFARILFILVVGAATDYSLLIVARYREELRRVQSPFTAMGRALRASFAIPGLFTPHEVHGRALVDGGLLAPLPIAATRMTQDILPPEVFEKLTPEYVAPVVAYLCTEEVPETASVFIVGGGKVQRTALFQNEGVTFTEVPSVDAGHVERLLSRYVVAPRQTQAWCWQTPSPGVAEILASIIQLRTSRPR